jgi:alcohol dehydrogenase (cytochrome c)
MRFAIMKTRLFFALFILISGSVSAQVTSQRLQNSDKEPQNWMTYGGNYAGHRYSLLTQITPENAKNLQLQWTYQPHFLDKMEATPLVVDGVMYMVEKDELVALDAATGRQFWAYHRTSNPKARACCEKIGRGLAVMGNTVYWGTIDAFLIALDVRDGHQLWQTEVANTEDGVHISLAPIAAKDKIILGLASSEMGGRCFLAAFDAKTGKQVWRFDTVPKPGEPGNETWGNNSWVHGGAPLWTTGTYDPELNLTYWGTGNPVPGWNSVVRPGDNLYSDSVVAIDVDTGKLKWYYQFTPGDPFDHDATQVPVLVDAKWQGQPRKLMFFANRNGFYYVLDRVTGKFLLGKAFVRQNWNEGFDENGKPIINPDFKNSSYEGIYIEPGTQGGTNWYPPSYSPKTGLLYIPTWEDQGNWSTAGPAVYVRGRRYDGSSRSTKAMSLRANTATAATRMEDEGYGTIRAIDPLTGEKKWDYKMVDYTETGVTTTASDVLFSGGKEGYFFALDDRDGKLLWKANLGETVASAPMTYAVNGRQYVAVAAGHVLYVFALPEQ